MLFVFFFFKQKTAYEFRISDWSSDVCSSDLARGQRQDRVAQDGFVLLLFDQVLRCWGARRDFHSLQWHVPGRLPRTRAAELFAHNVGGDTVQQRLPGRRWLGLAIAQKAGEDRKSVV